MQIAFTTTESFHAASHQQLTLACCLLVTEQGQRQSVTVAGGGDLGGGRGHRGFAVEDDSKTPADSEQPWP